MNCVVFPEQSVCSLPGRRGMNVNRNMYQPSGSKWETEWKLSLFRTQNFSLNAHFSANPPISFLGATHVPEPRTIQVPFLWTTYSCHLECFGCTNWRKGSGPCLLIPAFQPSVFHCACSLAFRNDRLHSE